MSKEMFAQPGFIVVALAVVAGLMIGMIYWAVTTIKQQLNSANQTVAAGWAISMVVAALIDAAIIATAALMQPWLLWTSILVATATIVLYAAFWHNYGGVDEWIPLGIVVFFAAVAIAWPLYWLGFGFFGFVPPIIGEMILVIDFFLAKYKLDRRLYQIIAAVVAAVLIICSIGGAFCANGLVSIIEMVKDNQVAEELEPDPEPEPVTWEPTKEYQPQPVADEEEIPDILKMYDPERFMNYALQFDDDPSNDFNFGPNVWDPNHTEAKYYDELWRKAMLQCPGICAGCLAWFDCRLGTRKLMGDFYEACKENWATAINAAKDAFILDPELQRAKCELLFTMLDEHATCVIRAGEKGITDQMYIDPYTDNGIPDVIVMETEQTLSHFLVYRVGIKGNVFEVIFRLECGFQPTNCAKEMDIKPVPQPTKKVEPQPTASGNNPPPPDEKKTPKKDKSQDIWQPSKGFPSNNGDEGPDTNNGKGAQESKYEETHTDTQDFNKPEDVKKEQQERKEVDKQQKTGEDPNNPTAKEKDTKKVEQSSERKEIKNNTKNEGGDNKGAWDPNNVP